MERNGSDFIAHTPCPACPSSDAFALFDDGHGYCFSCGHYEGTNQHTEERSSPKVNTELVNQGDNRALTKRHITEETTKRFDYQIGKFKGKTVQIANYKNNSGTTVAQKLRFSNKDFLFIGDTKEAGLYGQWMWRDGGKRLVVVEGEIDCLSVSQVIGKNWPVVSVPTGSKGAKKAMQKQLEWLCKFDSVILMFDSDDAGKEAAKECAGLFPAGKAKIALLPRKDANEMLVAGDTKEITNAMFDAKPFRPDGIVNGTELWDVVTSEDNTVSFDYP